MPAIGTPELSYGAAGPARLLVVTGADKGTQPTATGGYRVAGAFPDMVHSVFDEVRRRLGLDYFGMDFGIDGQGDVVLFEANAAMSFFPLEPHPRFAYLAKLRAPAQQAFMGMIAQTCNGQPSR